MLLACGAAQAQVIDCPPAFPPEQTALAGDSKAIVSTQRLTGGAVVTGELGGNAELHGDRKEVKGGVDVRYGFAPNDPKWFVCGYGRDGPVGSWRAVDPKATSCAMKLRTRGGVTTVRAECK